MQAIPWPIINTVYTGGRCPICIAPGRSSCSSTETLQCEGRASQCISISGQIWEGSRTFREIPTDLAASVAFGGGSGVPWLW
ncbi:unnamed protein product, partial [Lepidochelys olivacea]